MCPAGQRAGSPATEGKARGERDPQVVLVRNQDDSIEVPDAFVADLVRSHRADDSSSRGRVRGTPYR